MSHSLYVYTTAVVQPLQQAYRCMLKDLCLKNEELGGTRKVFYVSQLYCIDVNDVKTPISNCHASLRGQMTELKRLKKQIECTEEALYNYLQKQLRQDAIIPMHKRFYRTCDVLKFLPKESHSLFSTFDDISNITVVNDIPDNIKQIVSECLLMRSIYAA